MNTHALRGGELYLDFINRQIHRIVTRFGHFSAVTVSRAIGVGIETGQSRGWTARGHHQHIAIITHTRTAEMGM